MQALISAPKSLTKVERAYDAFRKLCPSLTQFATTLAGKPVRVVPGRQTETDGKMIWIRPPLSLGTRRKHSRGDCGRRNKKHRLICAACRNREEIMVHLHHELAHIMHGTFAEYDETRYQPYLRVIENKFPSYARAVKDCYYGGLANTVKMGNRTHPHISMINMAMEDVRINEASYKSQPGLRKMAEVSNTESFKKGVELDDGTFDRWQSRDLDQQMMIAPLFWLEGVDITGEFDQSVEDTLFSDQVQRRLANIKEAPNSMEVLMQSAMLLDLYRKAGFFQKHSEAEDRLSDEQLAAWKEFFELFRKLLGQAIGHGDDYSEGKPSSGQSINDEESPDERREMDKIVEVKEYLDDIPGYMTGFKLYEKGQGSCARATSYAEPIAVASEHLIGESVAKARIAFGVNQRARRHRNQKSGRVDSRALGRRAWNKKDDRLFQTKTVPDSRDYELLIGFDISGSTSSNHRLELLKESVGALADVCHRLGVKFSIYAHTTSGSSLTIYKIKEVGDNWDESTRTYLNGMRPGSTNFDGTTLQFYRKQIEKSRATDKIIMYFTDGLMPGSNTTEELPILKSEIEYCQRKRITLLGVGVYTDAPKHHGLDTVQVNGEADYPGVIEHLGKRLVRR